MTERIDYLDGLRGIAALIVVIFHLLTDFYPAIIVPVLTLVHTTDFEMYLRNTPLNILFDGPFAVCIFFVLSGYVLTYKFFQKGDNDIIISAASRRYLRLVVLVLFSILFAYIILSLNLFFNHQAYIITGSDFLNGFYSFEPNIVEAIRQALWGVFFDDSHTYNAVLWTMKTEFFGSMLVFAMAILFGKTQLRFVAYIVAIMFFINNYLFAFIIGMIIADFYNSKTTEKYRLKDDLPAFFLFIIGIVVGCYDDDYQNPIYTFLSFSFITSTELFYHILGAAIILLAILSSSSLKNIFSHKIMKFLGRISFSVYVLHQIIICSFSSLLFIILIPYLSYPIAFIIMAISTIVITISLAYLSSRYIDEPATKLSKKIYDRYIHGGMLGQDVKHFINVYRTNTKKNVINITVILLLIIVLLIMIGIIVL